MPFEQEPQINNQVQRFPSESRPMSRLARVVFGPLIVGFVTLVTSEVFIWTVDANIEPFQDLGGLYILIVGPFMIAGLAVIASALILAWISSPRIYRLMVVIISLVVMITALTIYQRLRAEKQTVQDLRAATKIEQCRGHVAIPAWLDCIQRTVKTPTDRDTCLQQVAETKQLTAADKTRKRLACDKDFEVAQAADATSYAMCASLTTEYASCVPKVTLTTADYQDCLSRAARSEIPSDICHLRYAVSSATAAPCGSVTDTARDTCLQTVEAINIPTTDIHRFCTTFTPFNREVHCIASKAIQIMDPNLRHQVCTSISPASTDSTYRAYCQVEAYSGATFVPPVQTLSDCFHYDVNTFELYACFYRFLKTEEALKQCLTIGSKQPTMFLVSNYAGGCRHIADQFYHITTTFVALPPDGIPER